MDAIAVKGRDGYFVRGTKLKVEMISPSVYRAYGQDALGYKFNCLVLANKIELLEQSSLKGGE